MPFDGVVTKAVIDELEPLLVSGRITKVYQPSQTEIILHIRNNRKNHVLLCSIHPMYARFHLTNDDYRNALSDSGNPPAFCMLMRKHVIGARIDAIEQQGLERTITFKLMTTNEIGDSSYKYLILEIMGRHSNLMLLNEDQEHIIDSLKHVPPSLNRHRVILPGARYIPPPSQDKLNPLNIDGNEFIKKLDFNRGKLDQQIVTVLDGVSPFLAQEITYRAHLGKPDVYKQAFLDIQQAINQKQYRPTIYRGHKEDFHVIEITSFKGQTLSFESTNHMLDQFYSGKAERDRVKQQAKDLHRLIKNELDKNKRKLKIHHKTLAKAENAESYQRLGELLTAHLYLVKPGDTSVTVTDYYDPEQKQVTIELDPQRSPSENAQDLFKTYRKLIHSRDKVQEEMTKTEKEIAYLELILQQLEVAKETDLVEIREELQEQGYLKRQTKSKKQRRSQVPEPEMYTSSEGITIYVGKNNKQNEYITTRLARRTDIWLHTKDIPGSHVVIRHDDPGEVTLKEAAQLAAYFSKARHSSSVPVDYTQIRHVRKPQGAKPGFVIYDHQKTIYVTPDETLIDQLNNYSK